MAVTGASYATLDDFIASGLPLGALNSIDKSAWQQMLVKQSSHAASYIGCKYTLPLSPPYDPQLVDAVCQLAAWRLICLRGFNPESDGDKVIRQGFLDAREWLVRVANGQAQIQVVTQATPESLQPDVFTSTPRGYGDITGSGTLNQPIVDGSGNWD